MTLSSQHVQTALVWGAERVGDVVMTIPAMKILRQHAPHALVRYVTTHYAREVIQLTGLVNEVRLIQFRGGIWNFRRWRQLRKEVREGAYDRIFLLGKVTKFREKMGTVQGAASIGTDKPPHKAARGAEAVLRGLGVEGASIPSPQVDVPQDPALTREFLDWGLDILRDNYVVVHTGCNRLMRRSVRAERPDKTWPPQKYTLLLTALARAHPDMQILLVGSREESPWIQRGIVNTLPSTVKMLNLSGRTSIHGLLQALQCARLLLCGDSGVMHLATMVGAPMVALFGPTDENRTGPFQMGERALILRAMPVTEARKDPACMDKIGVKVVMQAIERQLHAFPR